MGSGKQSLIPKSGGQGWSREEAGRPLDTPPTKILGPREEQGDRCRPSLAGDNPKPAFSWSREGLGVRITLPSRALPSSLPPSLQSPCSWSEAQLVLPHPTCQKGQKETPTHQIQKCWRDLEPPSLSNPTQSPWATNTRGANTAPRFKNKI